MMVKYGKAKEQISNKNKFTTLKSSYLLFRENTNFLSNMVHFVSKTQNIFTKYTLYNTNNSEK